MNKEKIIKRLIHKDVYKVLLINTNDYVFYSNTDSFFKYVTSFGNKKYVPKKQFLNSFDKHYDSTVIYVYRDINDYREICTNKIMPVLDYKKLEIARKSNDINKKIEAWISSACGIILNNNHNIFVLKNPEVKSYIFEHYMNDEKLKEWQDFLDYKILLANSNAISYLNQQMYENERILKK